ncbi:MAG: hypothetical protein R3B60_02730 [Candidatus Paceibacterota bacterium]
MTANIKKLGVYVVLTVTLMGLTVSNAQAQIITAEDVSNQERVVAEKILETLEEQLRLVQMVYIQRLERQVFELEMLVNTR